MSYHLDLLEKNSTTSMSQCITVEPTVFAGPVNNNNNNKDFI